MRKIKPYRQWFLQIPILFCSGSLVYFGLPYLALITHGFISVMVFIRSSNILTTADRQELNVSSHFTNEVVMFCQQIKPLVLECENNLCSILSTQDDALDTLTNSFKELQEIHIALDNVILKSKADSEVSIELNEIVDHLETTLNDSIRGLQFGDINGQNLIYTKDMLEFVNSQLDAIKAQSNKGLSQFLEQQPETIRNRQQTITNPVSSSSMSSGKVELF
jgi:hypothetical protein